jgi:hypothetical protein
MVMASVKLRAEGSAMRLGMALVLAVAMGGAVGLTSPATAAVPTAIERCMSRAVPNVDTTIDHPGNVASVGYPNVANQWNVLYPGDVLYIASGGSVRVDFWGQSYGPGGKSGL